MAPNTKQEIRDALQKEIQTQAFQRKFNRFRKAHPQLKQFATPQELVEFLHLPNLCNPDATVGTGQWLKDRLLHLLVFHYQNKPERKSWLMTLLLVISWKQMECTYSRFGYKLLNQINPHDPFASVYESYIEAFLDVKRETFDKFNLHLKDRAEYLIRKELKECVRFKGDNSTEVPAPKYLPWREQIDEMIWEWTSKGILNKKQSKLIVYRIIYEYTYNELEKKFKVPANTLKLRFHRAVKKLKPYLADKYFLESERFV